MSNSFDGKVAVVTGAGVGIGEAGGPGSRAERGTACWSSMSNGDNAEAVATRCVIRARSGRFLCDVSVLEQSQAVVEKAVRRFRRVALRSRIMRGISRGDSRRWKAWASRNGAR